MEKHAYATLITRESYLAGVFILAHTLRKHGSQWPLVVLYTSKLSSNAFRALKLESTASNIILQRCDYLLPPGHIKTQLIAERFEDTWTKLRVFELTGFDAVCYLDADMAVFRYMDSVFDQVMGMPVGFLAANHACVCNIDRDSWAPEDWRPENCAYTPIQHPYASAHPIQPTHSRSRTHHLLNGGMFLFRPSQGLRDRMLGCFNTTPLLATFKFPDQDFLAHFFEGKWIALSWQYNALKTMRYIHPNIWRDEEVICLHYIVDKPWARRIGKDGKAGLIGRDGITHEWWWKAYEEWEQERFHDWVTGLEVVQLVRRSVAKPSQASHIDEPCVNEYGM
ncbi:glycosyltransferase family 8 protein [Polychaeton citri CBS 116435]|uniref:Glycosyltransferase family 8 protein n=1 Tax=Polychaeton citri CBS 116435 TaxID=1314669 RepID=A0A9P4ULH0_9PEZI|nr:glycosyltransferase family 8 protein [Polychaeton citri CBS 116435]